MAKGIWVIVEHSNSEIRKVSLELLSQGRIIADRTGEPLAAIILGKEAASLADKMATYGADKVIIVEDEKLADYTTGAYTSVLNKIIRKEEPQAVLLGNTAVGKDLAPRLAQRLGVGMASDCTGMDIDAESFLTFRRPIYGGKAFAQVIANTRPVLATIRPNTFPIALPDQSRRAEVVKETAEIDPADLRAIVKDIALAASQRPELIEANIIISGGRGMKGPENYCILEACADVIGAAVGASRAAVDAGWDRAEIPGRTNRKDGIADALYRLRNIRSDPASRRNGYFKGYRSHQQGSGSQYFQSGRLWDRWGSF